MSEVLDGMHGCHFPKYSCVCSRKILALDYVCSPQVYDSEVQGCGSTSTSLEQSTLCISQWQTPFSGKFIVVLNICKVVLVESQSIWFCKKKESSLTNVRKICENHADFRQSKLEFLTRGTLNCHMRYSIPADVHRLVRNFLDG